MERKAKKCAIAQTAQIIKWAVTAGLDSGEEKKRKEQQGWIGVEDYLTGGRANDIAARSSILETSS